MDGSSTAANTAGIFVTEIGVSVETAADYQFVFNSNWPSIAIAFDSLATIGPGASVTVPHNLGFYPLTMGWLLQSGVSLGRIFAQSESFEGPQSLVTLAWDKANIYLTNNDVVTYQVDIKCHNLDITQSANYTLPQFPTFKSAYDPTVGIKVAKFNKGITSTDLRDFILHSRCQSPAVLAVVPGTGTVAYNNPANYVPWTFAFYTDSNSYYQGIAPGFQQSGTLFELGSNLTFTDINGNTTTSSGAILTNPNPSTNLSLVALRDPLVVSTQVQINYTGSVISG